MSFIIVVIIVLRFAVRKRGGECNWWILVEFVSVLTDSEAAEGLVGSVSWWVMGRTGCHGCRDSHLRVSHRGLGGRVSVSGGSGVGPIFWWRLPIGGGLVDRLLG